MFNWFKSKCDKQCEKSEEIDRKLKKLEEAERDARTISRKYLYNNIGFACPPFLHTVTLLRSGIDTEIEITRYGDKTLRLFYFEAEVLRDFLIEHYPIKEEVKDVD